MTSVLAIALPGSSALGLAFLVLGVAATFLMYHLWGYPFDKTHRKSEAPRWAMWLHRGLGYAFVACYVVMMIRMVPRVWTYQVELPPRTVAHLLLGFTIGFLLLIKIAIMRFFRHFEEWMPYLGTAILLCTVLLLALSLPFAFREHSLAHAAPGGDPFSRESQARVARLLPMAGMPADVDLRALASRDALIAGRTVVIEKCTTCHDLKTILDRPRTPEGWWTTVQRMGDKPALFVSLDDRDLEQATAYLVAITPDLQRAVKRKRDAAEDRQEAVRDLEPAIVDAGAADAPDAVPTPVDAAHAGSGTATAEVSGSAARAGSGSATLAGSGSAGSAAVAPPRPKPAIDPAKAQAMFAAKCSQCHETSDVDGKPPKTDAEARALVRRMVENGLEVTANQRDLILWWLDAHYVRKIR